MKIKDGYVLREVAGSNIVVPLGGNQVSFNGIMTLNPVGTLVWKCLEKGADIDEIVNAVLDVYDIDEATAKRDINIYVQKLREKDIVED